MARKKPVVPLLTPKKIYNELSKYIVGQEKAKKSLSVAGYKHLLRIRTYIKTGKPLIPKSNILMIGPTGVGKTYSASTLAKILKVPFASVDITEYTEAGYYGKDVDFMINVLQNTTNSEGDIPPEYGIIFIDEIDKIRAAEGYNAWVGTQRDVSGRGVQEALLKLFEGKEVFITPEGLYPLTTNEINKIRTDNILFICAGAFSDIYETLQAEAKSTIGFNKIQKENMYHILKHPLKLEEALVKYGMLPEFIGRLPVRIVFNPLTKEDYKEILLRPSNGLIYEYKMIFLHLGVNIELSDEAIDMIVDYAASSKMGARSLRTVLELLFEDLTFNIPSMRRKPKNYIVTKQDIEKAISELLSN